MLISFALFNLTAENMKLQIALADKAPSIDGNISEAEWRGAACASAFTGGDGEWPPFQTSTFVCTDGKNLYFAFKCHNKGEARALKRENDSTKIFGDESVELFIMPDEKDKTYYHLAFNALASVYSARCGDARDVTWDPAIQLASGKFDRGWTLEGSIPLKAMNTSADIGKTWKMNFGRNMSVCRNSSSWTGQKDFNNPELFGTAIVSQNAGRDFSLEQFSGGIPGKILLRNNKKENVEFSVSASCKNWNFARKLSVNASSCVSLSIENLPASGELRLKVSSPDFLTDKTAFIPENAKFAATPELYHCGKEQKALSVNIENLPEKTDRIEFILSDDEKTLDKKSVGREVKSISFNIADFPIGRYIINSNCMDESGRLISSDRKVFFIADISAENPLPEKQDIKISGSIFMMNGKVFFPFMRTASKTAASPLEKSSFNVKYGTSGARANAPLFDTCGLPSKVVRIPFTHYRQPSDKECFNSMDKTLSTEGNYIFRRLQYELTIKICTAELKELDNAAEYKKFYRHIKEKFPGISVSVQCDHLAKLNDFNGLCDVVEIASRDSSYHKNLIRNFIADISEAKKCAAGKPLIWWIGASIPHHEFRTAENIRVGAYLAITHGANGIVFHMGHDGIPENRTQLWSVFRGLADEMEFLYPIVIEGKKLDASEVSADKPEIDCAAFAFEDKVYIIAVNTSTENIRASFTLKPKAVSISMPFEKNRRLTVKDETFSDEFTGYEPHVYILDRAR